MKNILIVINPKAGTGVEPDFEHRIKSHCESEEVQCTIYWTEGNDDERRISDLLAGNKFDAIFSVGGDGTFTLVAGLAVKKKVQVAIIPMGTSNGLASDLGIDSDPFNEFKRLLKSNHSLKLDRIVVNGEQSFYHIGDIGANANLIKRFEKSDDSGYAAYTKHVYKELKSEEAFNYEIHTGENTYSGKARMIAICNARRFGTKVALNHQSHPADGLFELIVFRELNFKTLIESGLSSIWEGFDVLTTDKKEVIQTQSAKVRISPETFYQLDGEVLGRAEELNLNLHRGAVDLICPNNCPYLDARG